MMERFGRIGRLVPIIGAVALLVGCGEAVSSNEAAEEDFSSPSEQLMSVDERASQEAKVRSINRCLGLIEAVASLKLEEVIGSLRAQGIDPSASELFPIVLRKATQVELSSGLSETRINEIIEESKVRLETPEQGVSLAPEIKACLDAHRPAADPAGTSSE